jgi:uncharacterized protein YndB with AHSA1/START domain
MSSDNREERVVVTTFVERTPADAFEIFTREIDRWWKRTPRYRRMPGANGRLGFEGTPPARLVETDGANATVLARVLAWEPGKRLVLAWQGGDFDASDGTEVGVSFEAHRGGTRVTLEHHGLGTLPASHRVRHGFSGEAFEAMVGYFWAELLTGFRSA